LDAFKNSCTDDLIGEILPLLSESEKNEIFQSNDWELISETILRELSAITNNISNKWNLIMDMMYDTPKAFTDILKDNYNLKIRER